VLLALLSCRVDTGAVHVGNAIGGGYWQQLC